MVLASALTLGYAQNMKASTEKDKPKKKGRPATGKDPMVGFRSPPELTARIDGFAAGAGMKRAEAIRRLVEKGLSGH